MTELAWVDVPVERVGKLRRVAAQIVKDTDELAATGNRYEVKMAEVGSYSSQSNALAAGRSIRCLGARYGGTFETATTFRSGRFWLLARFLPDEGES